MNKMKNSMWVYIENKMRKEDDNYMKDQKIKDDLDRKRQLVQ